MRLDNELGDDAKACAGTFQCLVCQRKCLVTEGEVRNAYEKEVAILGLASALDRTIRGYHFDFENVVETRPPHTRRGSKSALTAVLLAVVCYTKGGDRCTYNGCMAANSDTRARSVSDGTFSIVVKSVGDVRQLSASADRSLPRGVVHREILQIH